MCAYRTWSWKKNYKNDTAKKNDTTAMATAINEIYIEWWHGNCFLVGDKTLVGRGVNFCGGEGEEVLWK